MQRARKFKKDWDGNRNRDAALRCTEHPLGECNDFTVDLKEANLSGDREAVNPAQPGTRAVGVLIYAARGEFPASRGVYLSLILNRLEATR
jgi:hypothetical protein